MFGKEKRGDDIPLFSIKGGKGNAELTRLTSCFSDPQTSVLDCLMSGNDVGLTSLLADVAELEDGELNLGSKEYPLPGDHWINMPTGREGQFRTLLHIAIDQNDAKAVFLLVRAGARADGHNEDLGVSPVHVACQKQSLGILQVLVEDKKNRGDLNAVMRNGRTPLHIAAENNSLDMVKFILENETTQTADPEDLMGRQTPLFLAVKKGNLQIVRLLLEYGADPLRTVENKTVREYMKEMTPTFDPASVQVKVKPKESTAADLVYSLNRILDKAQMNIIRRIGNAGNLNHFKTVMQALVAVDKTQIDSSNCGGFTFFQKACDYGLAEFVAELLENGADPNKILPDNTTKAVLLAAAAGHHGVIKVLLEHKVDSIEGVSTVQLDAKEKESKMTLLHHVLAKSRREESGKEEAYYQTLITLLQNKNPSITSELNRVMNWSDRLGNTPLHYATQLWSQETGRLLLERGANIGLKNNWDETPIAKIRPETMESFLDDFCLTSKEDIQHDDFELRFLYTFLAPPVDSPYFDEHDEEGKMMIENRALPETESLWYMSESKQHRHLLKHPVITSFLWLKWHRIRKYFNRNLRLYLMFVTCLSWFIFEAYGGVSYKNVADEEVPKNATLCSVNLGSGSSVGFWFSIFVLQTFLQIFLILRDWHRDLKESKKIKTCIQVFFSSWIEFFILVASFIVIIFRTDALFVILSILMVLVAFREALQMMVSLKRYFFDVENIMELLMLVVTAVILYVPDSQIVNGCETKRHLAAFVIVLAWATLITLTGRHPKMARYNIYVTMFCKVLKSFILFLTWYSFFIIAFGLGFYIMLHKDVPNHVPGEDDYRFFDNPWLSLVKTSTMFVGEIEFSDIPIDTNSRLGILGYFFLLSFVFLIVVVLMNLLNGLAVHDTNIIREEAEIVTYVSKVEAISCTEAVLLGDPFNFLANAPAIKALRSLPSLAFCRKIYQSSLVRDISNKITGATGILLFYTYLPDKVLVFTPNKHKSRLECCSIEELGEEVVMAAKDIVVKKSQVEHEGSSEVVNRLSRLENSQTRLENNMASLAVKMEAVLNKLNTM